MEISVFVGTRADGFLARPKDALDWLPTDGGEPHGYDEFFAGVDTVAIGRWTFQKVLTSWDWPYGENGWWFSAAGRSTWRLPETVS
jgi:hypothetical protein